MQHTGDVPVMPYHMDEHDDLVIFAAFALSSFNGFDIESIHHVDGSSGDSQRHHELFGVVSKRNTIDKT